MSSIIGYARVSTTDQNLEAQLEQLESAGATRIYQEKQSGVDRDRPELNLMLDYVRSGDTVIVPKIDRLARSTKDLLDITEILKKKNVTLRILNIDLDSSTPTGQMMLTMLGAIAQFERDLMLERQREGIERAKIAGKYKGRKATARAKSDQVKEFLESGYTKQKIADELNIGIASVYRIQKGLKG